MAGITHRVAPRPVAAAATLALVAATLGQAPVTSQSPSPSSPVAVGSAVPAPSVLPVDVGAIRWKRSKASKGFDQAGDGSSPLAFDVAVDTNGRFLLVGVRNDPMGQPAKALVWGSDDGVRWQALKGSVPKGSQAAAIVATDAGFLIAGDVGRSRALLLTSDGTRVSRLEGPADSLPSGALFALERAPSGLVAAGEDADHRPTLWHSSDGGTTWTGTPVPDASYVIHLAVTDGGSMVALGVQQAANGQRRPVTWASPDGMSWTASSLPVSDGDWSVPDLERTPLGCIATVVSQGVGQAWLSQDGVTWTQALEAPSRLTVGSAGAEAILFGRDTWWHSADGITWTETAAPAFDGMDVETSAVRGDGAVIAAGYGYLGPQGSLVRTWVGAPAAP